jgi:tRNA-Thr(GGU) m(6)t(6)A37 methyltransferase TsaA
VDIRLETIGIIHSPFKEVQQMPIQPNSESCLDGVAELYPEYQEGLKDLEGFSHLILLYFFHRVTRKELVVVPFLDHEPRGVFSTRAPTRPNPIGLSIVELDRIEANNVYLRNIDILDGTPLLDIKPYVPEFDQPISVKRGWLEGARDSYGKTRSDDRFE